MIVPTGSALRATSTFGPSGTAGAAAACCAPAPANMFLAITAVTTAMTKAPMSRASFFTSMARSPPLEGSPFRPHKSGKLVKKPLGENCEAAHGNGDPVRDFGPALPPLQAVPGENAQRQHSAGKRGQDQKLYCRERREPQRESGGELDVAAAHHAGIESAGEQNEHQRTRGELHADVGPQR